MIDKINRKESIKATTGKIKYGEGSVFFEGNGEVAAFEFQYKGSFKGVNCLSEGWEMKASKNKIIIYSLAQTPLQDKLFNYIEDNADLAKYLFDYFKKDIAELALE